MGNNSDNKTMLKRFFTLLLLICVSACTTMPKRQHDTWFGEDKMHHFLVASAIGAIATKVAANNDVAPCDTVVIGVSTTVVIGAGKEWYDKKIKKTFFSWKDMVWDFAGGVLGSFAAREC
jgi:putative lipoprotein